MRLIWHITQWKLEVRASQWSTFVFFHMMSQHWTCSTRTGSYTSVDLTVINLEKLELLLAENQTKEERKSRNWGLILWLPNQRTLHNRMPFLEMDCCLMNLIAILALRSWMLYPNLIKKIWTEIWTHSFNYAVGCRHVHAFNIDTFVSIEN